MGATIVVPYPTHRRIKPPTGGLRRRTAGADVDICFGDRIALAAVKPF